MVAGTLKDVSVNNKIIKQMSSVSLGLLKDFMGHELSPEESISLLVNTHIPGNNSVVNEAPAESEIISELDGETSFLTKA